MTEGIDEKHRFVRRDHFECFIIRKKIMPFLFGKPSLFYNKDLGVGIRISLIEGKFIWELATKKKAA